MQSLIHNFCVSDVRAGRVALRFALSRTSTNGWLLATFCFFAEGGGTVVRFWLLPIAVGQRLIIQPR
jgi:hypothetical protein